MPRPSSARWRLALAAVFAALSCTEDHPLAPLSQQPSFAASAITPPAIVISQVYGGGGNSGSVLRNDFIELFNPGTAAVSVAGWSVQYASAVGTTWQRTNITGTIPAGGYFLVQEAAGTGGTVNLPTPDATGTIPMAAGSGKVFVTNGTTTLTGACPTDASVIDKVSYGASSDCGFGTTGGAISGNLTAALRNSEGCAYTQVLSADFTYGTPNPRNSAAAAHPCPVIPPPAVVTTVTVDPPTATRFTTQTQQFTATAFDNATPPAPIPGATFAWTTSDPSRATVNASGLATATGPGDVTIAATAPNGVLGTATLHILAPPPVPDVRLSEIHYDNSGTDLGEALEVEGPGGLDVTGWSVLLYNGNGGGVYDTQVLAGSFVPRCGGRGVMVIDYPTNGFQNGAPDGMALVDADGNLVEFLSYEGSFTATDGPAAGVPSFDIGVAEDPPTPVGQSLQRNGVGLWQAAAPNSFGRCNSEGPAPPAPGISFSGRAPTDPPLPVAFEAQIFATERDGSTGATIPTSFTWSAETPLIASVDARGVIHALAAGTATFRATATDGVTATYSLPTAIPIASTTAVYAGNTEFGVPADGDDSDDFLVIHDQYTASYNRNRGTPNWVAYDLEATHIGTSVDRCNCFTHDPLLPSDFPHLTTADYTGAGSAAGYGIDRGHMTRSFDRTSGTLDNAVTYYLSNVVPQASDLNQGPWARMENDLGDLARNADKEVYIITGPAGNKGTVKNEGKIVIPTHTWKVAVIMPHDQGLADVIDYHDLVVIAVIMPNDPGVRNVDWHTYETTVDAVEAATGYDLLSLLPDQVEIALESNTQPPVPAADGPYAADEGSSINLSGAGSSDPDGDALTYAWDFGDGTTGTGAAVSHTYAQDGSYNVQLSVTDTRGLITTLTTTATVSNVAPSVGAFAGATLLPGETYGASGSFADPGADSWSATVDYGDGSGPAGLPLAGKTFSLTHTYATAGTFTVTVRVSDDDVTSDRPQTVTVLTPPQGVDDALELVGSLGLSAGNTNSLVAKLVAAMRQLDRGQSTAAAGQLGSVLAELDALVRSGRLSASSAAPLRALMSRIIESLSS